MIFDRLENGGLYPFGTAWETSIAFIRSLTSDTEEGRYEIRGDDIFALVMSYRTKSPSEAVLEAHRKYVDIQAVLVGSEGCEWFSVAGLEPDVPYSEEKDAEFYRRPHAGPARMDIYPGTFAAFFPADAHMPALVVGESPEQIKKVVVKIRAELLGVSPGAKGYGNPFP